MRLRSLLAAAVVLAALGVSLYFSNKQKAAEAAKPPDTSLKVLAVNEADITKISVRKKGGAETDLQKNSAGKWEMTSPEYPADQESVNQLATAGCNRECRAGDRTQGYRPEGVWTGRSQSRRRHHHSRTAKCPSSALATMFRRAAEPTWRWKATRAC